MNLSETVGKIGKMMFILLLLAFIALGVSGVCDLFKASDIPKYHVHNHEISLHKEGGHTWLCIQRYSISASHRNWPEAVVCKAENVGLYNSRHTTLVQIEGKLHIRNRDLFLTKSLKNCTVKDSCIAIVGTEF